MILQPARLLALTIALCAALWSADRTWDGGGGDDSWTTAANWDGSHPNGTGDSATMDGAVRLTPTIAGSITLGNLVFASGAGNFTIGGAGLLTMGGANPLIEVRAGAQTISCDFAVSGALTIVVYNGASLSIADSAIAGSGSITVFALGTGSVSIADVTGPSTPTWSAPATDGATTADPTPTWTWVSAGGSGSFRYQLDGGGWVQTASTSFTPAADLGAGSHTLAVQERDAAGNWSASATRSVVIDAVAPFIATRTTRDLNANGRIDAIDVGFSEAMSSAQLGTWTVAGYTVGTPAWQGGNTVLRLPLTELAGYDTAATPAVRYTAGSVQDAAGNALAVESSSSPAADGAAPVIVRAAGSTGSTTLTLVFSEGVATSAGGGNLVVADLAYGNVSGGGSTGISAVSQGDATGGSAIFTVNAAFVGGDIGSDTVAAASGASIYDLVGNAMATGARTIAAAPAVPTFSAPAATTNLATPTWTWSSGGGSGTYRFRLDASDLSSGATITTSTSFTPGAALADGSHTLYVQERDTFGVWSSTASRAVTIDATAPQIASRTTRDLDGDGQLDAVDVAFAEVMSSAQTGTWTVAGYTVGTPVWQGGNTTLRLPLTELATPDTGIRPAVRYVSGSVQDASGNTLATEGAGTAPGDGAAPVLVSAVGSGTSVTVAFSEPVVTTASGSGNLQSGDFAYTGTGSSISSLPDGNGLDQSVTVTTSAGVSSGSDTIAAVASQIFDLAGNAMGTAAVVIAAPIAARETAAPGDWDSPATWVGGLIPGYGENVVIRHAVTITQTGSSYQLKEIGSLVIETGGSLAATADVSLSGYYTIIYPQSRLIEARATTTVTNIQFYDGGAGDTTYKVSPGCVLTLTNGVQGHFTRSVIKQGTGELVWDSPANAYGGFDLGPTRVEAGTMRITKPDGRPAGYDVTVFGGATLDLQQSLSVGFLQGQGVITRSTVGTTVLTMNGSSWGGQIQDGGASQVVSVTANGGNAWSAANSFSGGLTLNGSLDISGTAAIDDNCPVTLAGGTLTVNDPETVGPLSGSGTVTLNAAIAVRQAGLATVFSGAIGGSGSLALSGTGSGQLTLSGANTYGGGTTLRAGAALVVSSGDNLGAAGGSLAFDGGTLRLAADVNLSGTAAASTNDGSRPGTTIAAAAADRPITVSSNGGTIDLATFSIALPAFSTAVGQDLTIAAGGSGDRTVFVTVPSGTSTWAGRLISSGAPFGWFIKRGAGTLEVSNAASTWSKSIVRPEEGTLRVAADGALGAVSSWVYTLAGATFELSSSYSSAVVHYVAGTMRVTSGSANWSGTTYAYPAVASSNTPTFDVAGGATLNLSGPFTYTQPWAKSGAGTMVLSSAAGANAGLTAAGTITAGTLQIARDDLLGAGGNGLTVQGGGVLATTATFASARSITLGAGGGGISTASSTTLTLSGAVGGAGGLSKTGAGTLLLSGSNAFAGGSQILAGVLHIASDAALGSAASGVSIDGGTLRSTSDIAVAATRSLAIGASGGTVEVAAGTTLGWSGTLSGAGSLLKTALGVFELSGANGGYSGAITVQAGSLRAASATALGGSAAGTTVQDGAALQLSGTFSAAEPLQLSGSGLSGSGVLRSLAGIQTLSGPIVVVQAAAPATVAVADAVTLSGVVSGGGGLTKIDVGDLTLSGSNTFTGQVTIGGGRLLVSADANLGDAANAVGLDGGTLTVGASINAAGRLLRVSANDGVIDLPAAGTILQLPGLDTAVGQDLTVSGAGTLRLNIASGGSTIAGALTSSGTAGLTKAGTGGLAITGANPGFTTTTTLLGGPLRLDGSLGGPVVVQSGAILGGTGSMGALSVQSGGVVKPGDPLGQGPGVLTAASLNLAGGAVLDYDLGTANDLISVSGSAIVAAGVQLNVLSFPAPGSFADGVYALINAAAAPSYGGSMAASLPNGYSLSTGLARATIGVAGSSLQLHADSVEPVVAAITSASPDGTYYQGQAFDVRVQFSKPVTPTGAVTVQLALNNGGAPVLRDIAVTAGAYPATVLSGSYTVQSGDITAPGEVNAADVVVAGSITDAVGHSVTGLLSTAGTLSSNKNIVIDNFVPLVQLHTAAAGDTQPPAVAMNTLDARVFNSTGSAGDEVLVLASDQETTDPAQFTYRLLLEPSQGEVQLLLAGTWASGTIRRVVTTVVDAGTQVASFTQADIDAGSVRYKHGSLAGGNDAILFDVTDGDDKVSALYLLRFAVSGNAVPVIDGLPPSLTYVEEATHAAWTALTASAEITDNDATFPGGVLSIVMTGAQPGDQLDLRPDAGGVSESLGRISVGASEVGTLTRLSATSLQVQFDDPTSAGAAATAAIINAIGYRTTSMAPDPTAARTIQVSLTDGSLGQIPNVYVVPVQIELYNDPPVVTVGAAIASVPGLARSFTVSVADPEGETALDFVIAPPPAPQATRGALVQTAPGAFTYTPYYPSGSASGDVLLDSFAIIVSDADFDPGSADPRRRGTAAAASSAPAAYAVRIADGAGDAPRFRAPMRLTVAAGLPFFYQPVVEAAPGAVLAWELVGAPAQLTTAIGASEASFDESSGQLSWPSVPAPADASGYYRFSILVTDTTSRTATLLPVMLRVGPGGAG